MLITHFYLGFATCLAYDSPYDSTPVSSMNHSIRVLGVDEDQESRKTTIEEVEAPERAEAAKLRKLDSSASGRLEQTKKIHDKFQVKMLNEMSRCQRNLLLSAGSAGRLTIVPPMLLMALIVLNDFTVVAIAADKANCSNHADTWHVARNITIGTVLGLCTLTFIMLTFSAMLSSMNPLGTMCKSLKVCLSYPSILTATFLLLSVSGRLEATNTRTKQFFCTLKLNRVVGIVMAGSISLAILLTIYWPLCPSPTSCNPYMEPVELYATAFLLLIQVPVHLLRDMAKIFTYRMFMIYYRNRREIISSGYVKPDSISGKITWKLMGATETFDRIGNIFTSWVKPKDREECQRGRSTHTGAGEGCKTSDAENESLLYSLLSATVDEQSLLDGYTRPYEATNVVGAPPHKLYIGFGKTSREFDQDEIVGITKPSSLYPGAPKILGPSLIAWGNGCIKNPKCGCNPILILIYVLLHSFILLIVVGVKNKITSST